MSISLSYFDHLQAVDKILVNSIPIRRRTKCGKLQRKKKPLPIEMNVSAVSRGPNMSRKKSGGKLYPFPSFDRSDSLLFFPTAYTSFLNSGDFTSLSRLMRSRFNPNCQINIGNTAIVNYPAWLETVEFINEIKPDFIRAVHQTKVVGNQIHSLIYFKYTESRALREAAIRYAKNHTLLETYIVSSKVALQSYLETRSDDELFNYSALVTSSDDYVVHGTSTMVLTFDQYSKKITHFNMDCSFISLCSV